jgi:hypothetical protein
MAHLAIAEPGTGPLVRLHVKSLTLLMFYPIDATQTTRLPPPSHHACPSLLSSSGWMAPIIVLPIAATVSALYALLLYPLKDPERLEAQCHHAKAKLLSLTTTDPPKTLLTFTALPHAHLTDIEPC